MTSSIYSDVVKKLKNYLSKVKSKPHHKDRLKKKKFLIEDVAKKEKEVLTALSNSLLLQDASQS